MLVRADWVHPWWREAGFFSKPPLLLWGGAAGLAAGRGRARPSGGLRLPVALLAILGIAISAAAVARLASRRAGAARGGRARHRPVPGALRAAGRPRRAARRPLHRGRPGLRGGAPRRRGRPRVGSRRLDPARAGDAREGAARVRPAGGGAARLVRRHRGVAAALPARVRGRGWGGSPRPGGPARLPRHRGPLVRCDGGLARARRRGLDLPAALLAPRPPAPARRRGPRPHRRAAASSPTWAGSRWGPSPGWPRSRAGSGRRSAPGANRGDARAGLALLCALWALAGYLLMGFAATRYPHYVLPVAPPLLVLSALFLDRLLDEGLRGHAVAGAPRRRRAGRHRVVAGARAPPPHRPLHLRPAPRLAGGGARGPRARSWRCSPALALVGIAAAALRRSARVAVASLLVAAAPLGGLDLLRPLARARGPLDAAGALRRLPGGERRVRTSRSWPGS